ncbi:zinc-binding alcohol dehydrogenase family protein [Thermoanaerobacterium sp. DL9XJH110]|uniref:zinc-binding alcohol dehydrogenase family protein n=1 Tax=Thermoanaerobacterium sp. DL9XJH110 TaxID=3386643 RepID=UPI003BB59AC9
MKAIKVENPNVIHIVDIPFPKNIDENEVMIKVKAAGICGSDLHIIHGRSPVAVYPRIIGHEVAGEVVKVGVKVDRLKEKDHVVVDPVISCGKCYACLMGRPNVCFSLQVRGVHVDGGFCEYIVVPEDSVHKISNEIIWEEAALVEPFTVAAQVVSRGNISKLDSVLILGAGPAGLSILQVVKNIGSKCFVVDINDRRLELAKKMGADVVINSKNQDLSHTVLKETDGLGTNVIIEAVGLPRLLEESMKIISPAGRIVVMGFIDEPSKINELDITKKEISIMGSRLHSKKFPEVIEWFDKKLVNPKSLISHVFNFTDIYKALELLEGKNEQVCKVILKWD